MAGDEEDGEQRFPHGKLTRVTIADLEPPPPKTHSSGGYVPLKEEEEKHEVAAKAEKEEPPLEEAKDAAAAGGESALQRLTGWWAAPSTGAPAPAPAPSAPAPAPWWAPATAPATAMATAPTKAEEDEDRVDPFVKFQVTRTNSVSSVSGGGSWWGAPAAASSKPRGLQPKSKRHPQVVIPELVKRLAASRQDTDAPCRVRSRHGHPRGRAKADGNSKPRQLAAQA